MIPLPLANHNPAISSFPQALQILISSPWQKKSPDNSYTLNMFNNNTYTNCKTAYKHMLILWWCWELFKPQEDLSCKSLAYEVVT